ncbi:MAG: nucleotidyltransferase family protein [Deltaproteobacteria bacterium]|nr:nucleotidyltransferase family protein [Deltaproteobacteria bacterium]
MKLKKAMLFAAGLGERMRPLTLNNPKPLLPLGPRPIIDYSLFYLKNFGIEEVVINLFYLGEKIEQHCGDGKNYGLKISYSKETELLGTGGGLKKAEAFFKNEETFVTMNSDTLINCDLSQVMELHAEQKSPATLVVAPWQEGYTRLQVANNRLLDVKQGEHLFTGLMILSPKIFEPLPEKKSNLILDGVVPLMQTVKSITAFAHEGYWRDIGTLESYQRAQEEWAASHHNRLV